MIQYEKRNQLTVRFLLSNGCKNRLENLTGVKTRGDDNNRCLLLELRVDKAAGINCWNGTRGFRFPSETSEQTTHQLYSLLYWRHNNEFPPSKTVLKRNSWVPIRTQQRPLVRWEGAHCPRDFSIPGSPGHTDGVQWYSVSVTSHWIYRKKTESFNQPTY